jgi:hypothetical protein
LLTKVLIIVLACGGDDGVDDMIAGGLLREIIRHGRDPLFLSSVPARRWRSRLDHISDLFHALNPIGKAGRHRRRHPQRLNCVCSA